MPATVWVNLALQALPPPTSHLTAQAKNPILRREHVRINGLWPLANFSSNSQPLNTRVDHVGRDCRRSRRGHEEPNLNDSSQGYR
ncbi:hypothetical protein BDV93DRAFT_200904 [Ceratobasidium sp. AG-I]|nr:hypothetical protein BDV93DRAFT_200904 [Ceratobasidium sp. AG-I]